TNGTSENPNGVTGEFRGCSHPQLLAWSTPNTIRPRPRADSTDPTQSNPPVSRSVGGSLRRRLARRIAITTTTSPANTSRHVRLVVTQPPRIGPTAIPAPATPPSTPKAAARALPSKLEAVSAT